jgi:hypothetical protein
VTRERWWRIATTLAATTMMADRCRGQARSERQHQMLRDCLAALAPTPMTEHDWAAPARARSAPARAARRAG